MTRGFLFSFVLMCGASLIAQPTISSTIYQGTTANPATVSAGAVLTHVIEIDNTAGVAPSSTVDLTGTISGPHTLMGTTGTQGWSSLNAWGSGTGPATAQWNNLAPVVGGDMIPVFGQNRFHGKAQINIGNFSTSSGGDGLNPFVYINDNDEIMILAVNHHAYGTGGVICRNLTLGINCEGSSTVPSQVLSGQVNQTVLYGSKLYYTGADSIFTGATANGRPLIACLDLSTTPIQNCTKDTIRFSEHLLSGYGGGMRHSIENPVILGDSVYTTYMRDGYRKYIGCINLLTNQACGGAYPYEVTGVFDLRHLVKLSNTKLAIAGSVHGSFCIDVKAVTNCDGTPISPISSMTSSMVRPSLNAAGDVTGFCAFVTCYDLATNTTYSNPFSGYISGNYTEFVDTLDGNARVYTVDTDNSGGYSNRVRCFDFAANSSCGNINTIDNGLGVGVYGSSRIPGTQCIVTYGDSQQMQFFTQAGSTFTSGCTLWQSYKWNLLSPADYYCDPVSETIQWDAINVQNMPASHTGGSIEVYNSASLAATPIQTITVPAGTSTFNYPNLDALVSYSTNPSLRLKLRLEGLYNITQQADIYLSYTVAGNKKPQFCFQSVVNCGAGIDTTGLGLAPLELQNHITLSGGASATGESPNMTTFVDGSCVLPIEWGTFYGEIINENAYLNWNTLSEQNNKGFEVERSWDGNSFEKIGFVAGKGNSTAAQSYQFVDYDFSSKAYYRLKQLDLDGKFTLSNTIELLADFVAQTKVYPNPSEGKFTIETNSPKSTEIRVVNALGQSVWQQVSEGYRTEIDLSHLKQGIYYLQVGVGKGFQTLPIVKK